MDAAPPDAVAFIQTTLSSAMTPERRMMRDYRAQYRRAAPEWPPRRGGGTAGCLTHHHAERAAQ